MSAVIRGVQELKSNKPRFTWWLVGATVAGCLAWPHASRATDFTDVTASAGLSTTNARGAAWGDYDNDGCVDLYVSRESGAQASGRLYKNNCDGTFDNVTVAAGNVVGPVEGWGAVWGDYNNDGYLDLYVTTRTGANVLYKNDGDGTFTDTSVSAGVADTRGSASAAWGDYDADGDLDLWVSTRYGSSGNKGDRLYKNNGNGTFTDVAPSLGIAGGDRQTWSGAWADFDDDGNLDLYLSVDFGDDVYYESNGSGGFSDLSMTAGISDPQHGMGIAVGDPNLDGCLDVVVTNNTLENPPNPTHDPTFMNVNNCNAVFTFDQAGILGRDAVEWGVNFVDFDNDGDEDLSIVAGGLLTSFGDPNALYENDGDGDFTDVTVASGASDLEKGFGSAWADYDNDGDLDWFVANDDVAVALFRNDGPTGNYFAVEFEGVTSNRFGIGARVEIVAGGVTQVRFIQAGESFLSSEEPVAFFGIGTETSVTSLTVEWPSGTTDVANDLEGNQKVLVKEGMGVQGLGCYPLTLSHTGSGTDPVASPTQSTNCPLNEYVESEAISLSGASPSGGWSIGSWSGTDDDSSTAATNNATMPAGAHEVAVHYLDPTIPMDMQLHDDTLSSVATYQACNSITLGENLEVTAGGDGVVVRAPTVILMEPTSVTGSGVLTVDSSPPEGCPLAGLSTPVPSAAEGEEVHESRLARRSQR